MEVVLTGDRSRTSARWMLTAITACICVIGCSSDSRAPSPATDAELVDSTGGNGSDAIVDADPEVPTLDDLVVLTGVVRLPDGSPAGGAEVFVGSASSLTDNSGRYAVETSLGDHVVGVRGDGIVESQGVVSVDGGLVAYSPVVLPQSPPDTFEARRDAKVVSSGTIPVEVPADALRLPSGSVVPPDAARAFATAWDNGDALEAMTLPGNSRGFDEKGEEVLLESLGAVHVALGTEDGGRFDLMPGAEMRISVPAGVVSIAPGGRAPLWHLDSAAGRWVETGEAVYDGDRTQFVADVPETGWWLVGRPTAVGCLRVSAKEVIGIMAEDAPHAQFVVVEKSRRTVAWSWATASGDACVSTSNSSTRELHVATAAGERIVTSIEIDTLPAPVPGTCGNDVCPALEVVVEESLCKGLGEGCKVTTAGGAVCPGVSVCDGGAWACQAIARPEVCNGLDDDCDGETDESTCQCDEGLSCDDADACTVNDRCVDGRCSGDPISCDDGEPCTTDLCFPWSGCTNSWPAFEAQMPCQPCLHSAPATQLVFEPIFVGEAAEAFVELSSCGILPTEISAIGFVTESTDSFSLFLPEGGQLAGLTSFPSAASPQIVDLNSPAVFGVRYQPTVVGAEPGSGANPTYEEGEIRLLGSNGALLRSLSVAGVAVDSSCPLPRIGTLPSQADVTSTIELDGSGSVAPNGDIESWAWSVESPGDGPASFVPSASSAAPNLNALSAGDYRLSLDVADEFGTTSCAPAQSSIWLASPHSVQIELVWDTPNDPDQTSTGPSEGSDLDLHFAHPFAAEPDFDGDGEPDGWFSIPHDCFWFNPNPEWEPQESDGSLDPVLEIEDTDGAGPERIRLTHLPASERTYSVGVHYYDDHDYGPSFATVRIYLFSRLVYESEPVGLVEKDLWDVARIHWPSGTIQVLTDSRGAPKITPDYESLLLR